MFKGQPSDVSSLPTSLRTALEAEWTQMARAEHAAVASFARFTLQLMSIGAPAELLGAAQTAAADECRHAKICFGLAAVYGGRAVEPSCFPVGSSMDLQADLKSVAIRSVLRFNFGVCHFGLTIVVF